MSEPKQNEMSVSQCNRLKNVETVHGRSVRIKYPVHPIPELNAQKVVLNNLQ